MPNDTQTPDNPLAKFDAPVLKSIEGTDGGAVAPRALFLPSTFPEAMELAKLMASSNFVPKHLRGRAGDCLAVVIQASRWGMDPFAVGNKTYFVNDRMAYEAQLVAAVVNSSGRLEESLHVHWDGEGEELRCTVTGKIKGESREKAIEQKLKTIKVRNSPLWVASPRMQLGYYTQRLWARLYVPETLMGVYSVDEVEQMEPRQVGGTRPAAPTRAQVAAGGVDQTIDGGDLVHEVVDQETGEVTEIDEATQAELDRESLRTMDADAGNGMQDEGDLNAAGETAEDVEADRQHERMREDAATRDPQPEKPKAADKPKAEPKPKPADKPKASSVRPPDDWNAWLAKQSDEMGAYAERSEVEGHRNRPNVAPLLEMATTGLKNRYDALERTNLKRFETATPAEQPQPESERIAESQSERAELVETDQPGPAKQYAAVADGIIDRMNAATTIIDLRQINRETEAQQDKLPEIEQGRVVGAFRALEDKLLGRG